MTSPIPQVFDAGRRALRTAVQAVTAFLTLAPVYIALVGLIRPPDGSNLAIYLTASVAWVGGVSALLSKLMSLPAVNTLLAKVGLAGHSGDLTAADTYTSMFAAITPTVPGQVATGPQPRH